MFKNLKIGVRLTLSYGIILLFLIAVIIVSLKQISVSQKLFDRTLKVNNVRLQLANNMIDNTREVSITLRNILLLKNIQKTSELVTNIYAFRKKYDNDLNQLEKMITPDDTASLRMISEIKTAQNESRQLNNNIIGLAQTDKYNEAIILMNERVSNAVSLWVEKIGNLISHNEDRTAMLFDEASMVQISARITMLILGIISVITAIIISIFLTLSITVPLNKSVQIADSIASKDLRQDVSTAKNRKDEFGTMIQSFKSMIDILREQMQNILEGVNVLASSSSEILASTTQIASGSAETAAAITETSTTVEEVRQAALLSSQKAMNLSDRANQVAQVSQNGNKAVSETIDGMNHIRKQMEEIAQTIIQLSEQSQSIGGIIASVTDLADQSNLLAVNAAIEAAKAGEQGKGFAVVAQEIRNLSDQSRQATNQVRTILNDIQKVTTAAVLATERGNKAVEDGVNKSYLAGDAIRILAESSFEAAAVSSQIVASSQQQLAGMDQIGAAMQNINQAGIETASSMTQAEESVKNLHDLGQKLKDIVEQFKI